jgi:hypothetical protein
MAELTPEHIIRLVLAQEIATDNLRIRMDADYSRYLLDWTDDRWEGGVKPEKYHTYISNEPRTFADRMIALLVSADMMKRVPYKDEKAPERDAGRAKERFFQWALDSTDEAMRRQLMPSLRQQTVFYTLLRGWYCGRALLYKAEDGATKLDITPFDPLHTSYGVGSNGLKWVCHKLLKTRDEIEDEYGEEAAELAMPNEAASESSSADLGIVVYDFYDEENNAVVIGKDFVKDPTPHGAKRVPCYYGFMGSTPFVQRKDETQDTKNLLREVGESIYASLRDVYDDLNKTLSDRLTLIRRILDGGYIIESETGAKTLSVNPFTEGSEVSLKIGERLIKIPLQEMNRDTDLFLAQVTGDVQRGSVPHTVYGEIQFSLSGYAINTLRQGLDLRIQDGVLAVTNAYRQIADLISEQYATGMYAPVVARGGFGQSYYREVIDPAMVAQADELEIELLPRLPQDDVSAYNMAKIASDAKLLSRRTIMDNLLKLEDADAEIKLMREEIAETASPLAALTTLINTAVERGRMDLAAIYFAERMRVLAQMGLAPMPAGGGSAAQPSNGAGMPSEVLPPQAQGIQQPTPTGIGAGTGLATPPMGPTGGQGI